MIARLVLPDFWVSAREIARCRASLRLEFGDDCEVLLAADAANLPLASTLGEQVTVFDQDAALRASEVVAFIEERPGRAATLQALSSAPVYRFSFRRRALRAQLLPVDPQFNREKRVLSANIFHRLGPDHPDTTIFFPRGYVHRQLGMGPLDDFGHRLCHAELSPTRPSTEKIIAVFGGSAAWSAECLAPESFPAVLETMFNETAAARGSAIRLTVVNFGGHGNVVLDEIQKFCCFCIDLAPDFVIAHDGYNDFVYGLISDPDLLGKHLQTYQEVLEDWSPRLHRAWDASALRMPQERFKVRNSVEAILRAYYTRKRQFERLATALGSHFIWGLQPYLHSKADLSDGERGMLAERLADTNDAQRLFYEFAPPLYDAFVERSPWRRVENRVDCHAAFRDLPRAEEHFVDFVHCTPEGDAFIAKCYSDYIARLLIPAEQCQS
jgi:hypothetical protein